MSDNSCTVHGVPINPGEDSTNRIWWPHQLYRGPGTVGHIPSVGDLIVDFNINAFRKVISVDVSNRTWVDEVWRQTETEDGTGGMQVASDNPAGSSRIYVDSRKHPSTLRFDPRWTVTGSDLHSVRVFRGTDISERGEVISGYFLNNIYQGDTIPLKAVSIDNVTNKTVKSPVPGSCVIDVDNNELVTVVVYSDVVGVALVSAMHIVKTNMVMALDNPARQVIDVKLKSPFLSASDDRLLKLPINLPLDDIPLDAEIIYTDGKRTITVDGTRASLHGLRNSGAHDLFYISSIAGEEIDLTLNYHLASNETYIGNDVMSGVIKKHYRATTLDVDGAYSVKLYVRPVWLDSERGYRLEYYLYNLERGNFYDATPYIKPAVNAPVFDPKLYNVKQRVAVTLDLADVSPEYVAHIHPQSFYLTLVSPATEVRDNFYIEYVHGQAIYGEGIYALFEYVDVEFWKIDLRCGATDKAEWLERLYYNIHPLYDRRAEDGPVAPTHFELVTPTKTYLKLVDEWVEPFNIDYQVKAGETLGIRWICRTPSDDLQLGFSPIIAHQKP